MSRENDTNEFSAKEMLRSGAEQTAQTEKMGVESLSVQETQQLLQELRNYQIELELQAEDLRQSQFELAQSRDRYADLYDFAPVGYVSQNSEGKILAANLAAASMLGVDRQKLVGANVNQFLQPESQDVAYRHCHHVLASAEKQSCEVCMRTIAGEPLEVRLETIAYENDQGRQCRTALIDITAAKNADQLEQRVRERTALLQAANDELLRTKFTVDTSKDAIFWVEQDGRFRFVNEAACRLSGYRHEELCRMSLLDLDADLAAEHWPNFWERIRHVDSALVERGWRTKRGKCIAVELSTSRLQFDHRDFVCVFVRDISARKETERQLSIKDKAIESAAAGIMIADLDGTITYGNPASARMWGYDSSDEIVGRPSRELLLSEADSGEVMQALQSNRHWMGECTAKKKDGTPFDIEVAVSMVRDHDGGEICMMASLIDISERKQAEQRQRKSQSFAKSILASLSAHIAVIDDAGTIVAVNPAWETFATENQGLLDRCGPGVNYLKICRHASGPYSDEAPAVVSGLQAILRQESSRFSIEYPCHSPTNKRWFLLNATPLVGEVAGAVITHVDITRRRQSEEDLLREHRFAENLIQTAPNIVLVLDAHGKIVRFNPYVEKLTGWRWKELSGKDWVESFVPRDHREQTRALFHQAMIAESTRGVTVPILTRDGRQRETEWYFARLTDDVGRVSGLLCTGRDITERKALERHVLEVASEEQRRIGQDLHDGVGQQLTGLGMMADTLSTSLQRKSLPESEVAEVLANGLKQAVGEVRQLARGLNPVEVDAEGLRSALEELTARSQELYGIRCSFECQGSFPLADSETATQLFRIAQEALNNAARHARATSLIVSLKRTKDTVELQIVDNGTGFENITSPGLGLRSMGYRAGVIGGKLEVEPGRNGGTVVRCWLPLPESMG